MEMLAEILTTGDPTLMEVCRDCALSVKLPVAM